MQDPKLVAASAIALAVTLFAILSMRQVARRIGLVDKPDARKHHRGHIPLIGGMCFFIGTLVGLSYLGYLDRFSMSLMAGSTLIVLTGIVDDFSGLSVRSRLLAEAGAAGLVIAASGCYVDQLGPVFGDHHLALGVVGIPLTIIAVIGIINAFNMLDGIDGLAASMAMASIATILLFNDGGWSVPGVLLLLQVLFAALIPYLFVNMGWPDGRKVFMGDAGSTLIGFLLAWSLIYLSRRGVARLAPVDALWCVAIPVMDTLAVMYRRMRQGGSPFKPDRQHIHHLLLDAGMPSRIVLLLIVTTAGILGVLGHALHGAPAIVSALAFVAILVAYVLWLPPLVALPRFAEYLLSPGMIRVAAIMGNRDHGGRPQRESGYPSEEEENVAVASGHPDALDAAEAQGPLKALCLLADPSDGIRIAPIAQQLSQDDRFESTTVCVTTALGQETEETLQLFGARADHRLEIVDSTGDEVDITSAALGGMKRVLNEVDPDVVLVPGESAASLATTLAAYYREIPVVCIEAEPSGAAPDPHAPVESNRGIVRALASLHVAQSTQAGQHLIDIGVPAERVLVAGDTSSNALHAMLRQVRHDPLLRHGLAQRFSYLRAGSPLLLVIARDLSTDDFEALAGALWALARQRPDVDIICPAHMGCHVRHGVRGLLGELHNVHPVEPLDYLASAYLLNAAYLTLAGCDVLVELIDIGKPMLLVGGEVDAARNTVSASIAHAGSNEVEIADRILTLLDEGVAYEAMCTAPGNDEGDACQRVLDALTSLRPTADMPSAMPSPGVVMPVRPGLQSVQEMS